MIYAFPRLTSGASVTWATAAVATAAIAEVAAEKAVVAHALEAHFHKMTSTTNTKRDLCFSPTRVK